LAQVIPAQDRDNIHAGNAHRPSCNPSGAVTEYLQSLAGKQTAQHADQANQRFRTSPTVHLGKNTLSVVK